MIITSIPQTQDLNRNGKLAKTYGTCNYHFCIRNMLYYILFITMIIFIHYVNKFKSYYCSLNNLTNIHLNTFPPISATSYIYFTLFLKLLQYKIGKYL